MKTNRYWIFSLFILTCLAQWYILGRWMSVSESVKSHGTYLKIPCTQIDPVDPFRGTYLNIRPTPGTFNFKDSAQYINGQDIWINYTCDTQGICNYVSIQPAYETPQSTTYIKAKVIGIYPSYVETDSIKSYFGSIEYPFHKYYINEKAAPVLAEKYNKALGDTATHVYAGVYVYNGETVLDGIWLGDIPLR